MLSARPATPADVDEVARLWDLAVGPLSGQRGGPMLAASLSQHRVRATTTISDNHSAVVLGLVDTVPVGMSFATLLSVGARRLATVELLYVEPQARRIGVGEAMLERLLEQCEAWEPTSIDAPALPGDRASKSFFEAHGFKARLLVMQRFQAPAGVGE